MKQGLQESRYPISLIHGYTQIGDVTWSTRVKLPNTTAQREDDVIEKLFIYMQNVWYSKRKSLEFCIRNILKNS
jgi:hypothetical protein